MDSAPAMEEATDTSPMVPDACARPPDSFRFMDLPAELRLQVYAELVIVGKVFYTPTVHELKEGGRFKDYESYRKPELQILQVSKQVHDEAEEVYLSKRVIPGHWSEKPTLYWPFSEIYLFCHTPAIDDRPSRNCSTLSPIIRLLRRAACSPHPRQNI
jgi:hypothetical protein